jgi:quercetin dioxygenase-like cupin family protein
MPLPTRTLSPSAVPVDVLSVSAFTRAINQAHGTNAALQHLTFTPGESTLWHTRPGPNLVLVVGGSLTLTDEHGNVTTYTDGQGFAAGLKTHLAVAGPARCRLLHAIFAAASPKGRSRHHALLCEETVKGAPGRVAANDVTPCVDGKGLGE